MNNSPATFIINTTVFLYGSSSFETLGTTHPLKQCHMPFSNSTARNSHLAPCRLIHTNILEELHVSIIKVEFYTIFKTRASRFLHNVALYLSDCTVSYPTLTAIT
jgi:hypothetical protein